MIGLVYSRKSVGALALILTASTACSVSTGDDEHREPGSASCVGIVRVNGHDYEPWRTAESLKGRVTEHQVQGTALACPDGPSATTVTMRRIRGIPPSQGLFGQASLGYRQIYVPASEWGNPLKVPPKVQDLLE